MDIVHLRHTKAIKQLHVQHAVNCSYHDVRKKSQHAIEYGTKLNLHF